MANTLISSIPAGEATNSDFTASDAALPVDINIGTTPETRWVKPSTLKNVMFVGCSLTVTVAPTITTGTETKIAWNSERYDTNTMHDNATNNTRITIPSDGYYLVTCGVTWTPGTGNRRNVTIKDNAGTILAQSELTPNASTYTANSLSVHEYFTAGDYVEIYIFQDQGTDLDVFAVGGYCHVEVCKL